MRMKNVVINIYLVLSVILFFVLLGIAVLCAIENEIGLCIGFSLFLAVPVIAFVFSPLYFVFSDDCVEIVYHFDVKEQIRWKDIQRVTLMGSWFGKFNSPPHYVIAYYRKGKVPFFVAGRIPKTRKTKKLIKQYYKRQIVGQRQ